MSNKYNQLQLHCNGIYLDTVTPCKSHNERFDYVTRLQTRKYSENAPITFNNNKYFPFPIKDMTLLKHIPIQRQYTGLWQNKNKKLFYK